MHDMHDLTLFHLSVCLLKCLFQVAYYGEPSMAPELFIKAYTATSTEYQLSEDAPRIDAKNPAGENVFLVIASHPVHCNGNACFKKMDNFFMEVNFLICK